MYQRHKLRRIALLFVLLSASLWAVKVVWMNQRQCETQKISSTGQKFGQNRRDSTKGAAHQPVHTAVIQNITSTFERGIEVFGLNTVESSCNGTGYFIDTGQHYQHVTQSTQRTGRSTNYFATLTVVGELHLNLDPASSGLEQNAADLLNGIVDYIRGSDETFTSIDSAVSNDKDITILSSLRALGVSLVSLASEPVSQLAIEDKVRSTVHTLEAAEMKWFGLNAKKHQIVTVNRQRIGCLAFCAVHNMCTASSQLPFGPVKYSTKLATTVINELKSHGVSMIIVVVYWGRKSSLFPDEMALPVARHLASLGVDVVIGYHPNGVQGHAYMGKTLILFSLGHILSSDHAVSYCWNKVSKKWRYSVAKECVDIQPAAREGLLQREMHTRIYRLHISKSAPVAAEYVTLPLEYGKNRIRRPIDSGHGHGQNWTTVCGERDTHCLSCEQF